MEKQCYTEIIELHSFFQDWFNGKLEMNEKNFQRFPEVLDTNFELITPRGEKYSRKEILQLVWKSHASRKNSVNPMTIWIENFTFRMITSDIFLVTYEEWQKIESKNQGRLSTAIFSKNLNKFNGIDWVHVHVVFLST